MKPQPADPAEEDSQAPQPGENPFSVTLGLKRQLGFTLSILLAFVGGAYFGGKLWFSGRDAVVKPTSPPPFRARYTSTAAEPEDFFPVAEFRRQAGLVFGGYNFLNTNPQLYVDIARAIDRRLPVFTLVDSENQAALGRALMRKHNVPDDAMRFVILPADSPWVRDYAPFMIRRHDNSVGMIDAKYQIEANVEPRRKDEEMAVSLSEVLGLPIRSIPLVLEGGNFLSNGDGVAVSTNHLFLKNQEYEFSEIQIASMLHDFLGVRRCYLMPVLEGEATGHVDMMMCFVAKNIAVVGEIPMDLDPENSRRLDNTTDQLKQITTTMGPMQVFRIPMPPPSGQSWRSYTNAIFANGMILMPSFSDVDPALEDKAEAVYKSVLPGWKVKRIVCDQLVREQGQLHCISYNIPNYVNLDTVISLSK